MGGTHSKSSISSAINQSLKSNNTIEGKITDTGMCRQTLNLSECKIEAKGDIVIRQDCSSISKIKSSTDGKISSVDSQTLDQNIAAAAKAQGVNLNLNPGSTSAESSINTVANLSTEVSNVISNDAKSSAITDMEANINKCSVKSTDGKVSFIQTSAIDKAFDTITKGAVDSSAGQAMTQKLSASSSAVTKDAITSALLAAAALLLVMFIGPAIGLEALGASLIPIIVVGSVFIVCGYTVYSCTTGKWPCYRQCLYAPDGKDKDGNIYTMRSNPCCANPTTEDGKPRENKNCFPGKDAKTYSKFNGVCQNDNESNACTKQKSDLSEDCMWTGGGKGECKSGMNKGLVAIMVSVLIISLFGGVIYMNMHKSKKDGASQPPVGRRGASSRSRRAKR